VALLTPAGPIRTSKLSNFGRGFGSIGLFSFIKKKLGWDYIIRIKDIIEFYDEQHPLGRTKEELRLVRGEPAAVNSEL